MRCACNVVEAAGIEPATSPELASTKAGQHGPKAGHNASQTGQLEGVAVCPMGRSQTTVGQHGSKDGLGRSITGAQRAESADASEDDSAVIVKAWEDLPSSTWRAVVTVLRSLQSRCTRP